MNLLLEHAVDFANKSFHQYDIIVLPPKRVKIPVTVANEEDWEFVFIRDVKGYHMSVF